MTDELDDIREAIAEGGDPRELRLYEFRAEQRNERLGVTMSETPWIVVNQEEFKFECTRCEQTYTPSLPCSLTMMSAMSHQFVEDHTNCPSLLDRIQTARDRFEQDFVSGVRERAELDEFRKLWLGKDGPVTALAKKLGPLSPTDRKEAGEALNNLTRLIKATAPAGV